MFRDANGKNGPLHHGDLALPGAVLGFSELRAMTA
jgi:hypothetical protein